MTNPINLTNLITPYGILFALGLAASCYYVWYRWKDDGGNERDYEIFIILEFISIFIGARLCHCLCYEPQYFIHHPTEMLLPVKIDNIGQWHFTGYHGLASHGGVIGAITGAVIYRVIRRQDIRKTLDWAAIATPLFGTFIRIGNFTNGEIIGKPTDMPWGVIFSQTDNIPRHPAQLYEATFYLAVFTVAALLYRRYGYRHVQPLFYFGCIMTAIATFRILIENIKEVQVPIENNMTINIGQLLSIPFIIAGITVIYLTTKTQHKKR